MPTVSQWTELLGETLLEEIDALCEEIKTQLGWPPLGQARLSPSGARAREMKDAGLLADLFTRVGPEMSVKLLRLGGVELVDQFGERVVSEALREASRAFLAGMGADGREATLPPPPEGGEPRGT